MEVVIENSDHEEEATQETDNTRLDRPKRERKVPQRFDVIFQIRL